VSHRSTRSIQLRPRQKDDPLTIRAWTRFFAGYEAISEDHGPVSDSNFSDVFATGGQIWRGGVPQTNRETTLPDHGLVL
jgi:hypothetical protein